MIKLELTVGELLQITTALRRDEHTCMIATIREIRDPNDLDTNVALLNEAERHRRLARRLEALIQ